MNKRLSQLVFCIMVFVFDIVLVYFSFFIAYQVRFHSPVVINFFPVTKGIPLWLIYKQLLYFITLLWGVIFLFSKFYQGKFLSVADEFVNVVKGVTIATFLTMGVSFAYRGYEYSRLVFAFVWLISIIFIFLLHDLGKYIYTRIFTGVHNVLIIGNSKDVRQIRELIRSQRYVKPFFILEQKDNNSLLDFISSRAINEVLIAPSAGDRTGLMLLADECEKISVEFKIVPDVFQLRQGEIMIDDSLGIPVLHIKPVSLHGFNFYFKRVFDTFVSIIALSFLFFPLVIVMSLIKLDSLGPVFYRHKRMGQGEKPFDFFKFRTMIKNADVVLEKIKHLSERDGPVFKLKNDPRVTGFGKFLRRYSIDELPQLLNVLRGEMSLVGPRPQVLWEAKAYDDWARRRLRVLPGITGLWQVSGRASLSYEEMIELDIYYIQNWSFGLDLKILLKTMVAIFSKKGAF